MAQKTQIALEAHVARKTHVAQRGGGGGGVVVPKS